MVETCPSRQPKVRLKYTGKRVSGITSEQLIEITAVLYNYTYDFCM